jgi:uracil-DNA glycosylase
MTETLSTVLRQARACVVCAGSLSHRPRPVLRVDPCTRVLLIGQAPGAKVHASGIDWNDASGVRLRAWLGVTDETFYGPLLGVMPMGFCYPGTGNTGDLPPRPECAPLWHARILALLPEVRLTMVIGQYAQAQVLEAACKDSLPETVRAFAEYGPRRLPLPHPSPRNAIWQRENPWFDEQVLPVLKKRVRAALK